jgi:TIR domain
MLARAHGLLQKTWAVAMADVFISYSKSEPQITKDLAKELELRGISVWWDTELVAGEMFHKTILEKLQQAKAVVVIWTRSSVESQWVLSEASRALKLQKLIQIRSPELNPDEAPPPFDTYHMPTIGEWRSFLAALRKLGVPVDVPEPAGDEEAPPPPREDRRQSNEQDSVRALQEVARWNTIKDSDDGKHFGDHLKLFPHGAFADLAREKWEAIRWRQLQMGPVDFETLKNYLHDFPDGRHSVEVAKLLEIQSSKEESAHWRHMHGSWWKRVTGARSGVDKEGLKRFIERFPKGAFSQRAQDLAEFLRREQNAWDRVQHSSDVIVVQEFLKAFPDGPNAAAAKAQCARLSEQTPSAAASEFALPTESPRSAWRVIGIIAVIGFAIGFLGTFFDEQRILGYWVEWGDKSYRIISADVILRFALISTLIYLYGVRSFRVFLYTFFLLSLSTHIIAMTLGINVNPQSSFEITAYRTTLYSVYFLAVWACCALFAPHLRDKRIAILATCIGLSWGALKSILFVLFPESTGFAESMAGWGIINQGLDGIESSLVCAVVGYGLLRAPVPIKAADKPNVG